MAREPKIAYVMLRNAHFGPRLAASVELCVRDLVVHSRYARSTLVVCPPVDEPFEGIEIATIPDAPISGNLGKAWGVAQLAAASRRRSRHCRKSSARGGVHRADLGSAGDFANPRLCQGADRHVGRSLSPPGDASAFRLRLRQRIRLGPVPRRFPRASPASARRAQRARHASLVGDKTEGPVDPLRGPGAPSQGSYRGDGGDHTGSAFASRLERPLHGVRPSGRRPGAGNCRRASRRRRAFQRPDQGRRQRALCRGQGGVGARRSRNGADDRSRTVRPNGARSDGERRRAHHLGAGRLGRDLRSVRGDGRTERRQGHCDGARPIAGRARSARRACQRRAQAGRGAVRYPSHRAADGRIYRGLRWRGATDKPKCPIPDVTLPLSGCSEQSA